MLPCCFQQIWCDSMVADDPGQFWKFEGQQPVNLVPLELHIPLTMDLLLLVIKVQDNPELFMRSIKQSTSLYRDLGLSIILTLIRRYLDISDEIIPESMWQLREILTIDADI